MYIGQDEPRPGRTARACAVGFVQARSAVPCPCRGCASADLVLLRRTTPVARAVASVLRGCVPTALTARQKASPLGKLSAKQTDEVHHYINSVTTSSVTCGDSFPRGEAFWVRRQCGRNTTVKQGCNGASDRGRPAQQDEVCAQRRPGKGRGRRIVLARIRRHMPLPLAPVAAHPAQ